MDKEEPTRQVLDSIRTAGKKRKKEDDGILEEDYKSFLLDYPTTVTVSDLGTKSSAEYEVKQSGAQLPVLEEARSFTSSDISTLFDGSVSSSLGSMRPLVEKLDKLLDPAQEYYRKLPKRIKEGMHLLKDDLEVISSYFDELSEVEDPPPMAMCWMNEARDLSYDMEDYINSLLFVPPDRFIKKKKKKRKRRRRSSCSSPGTAPGASTASCATAVASGAASPLASSLRPPSRCPPRLRARGSPTRPPRSSPRPPLQKGSRLKRLRQLTATPSQAC